MEVVNFGDLSNLSLSLKIRLFLNVIKHLDLAVIDVSLSGVSMSIRKSQAYTRILQ